ncbi:MAG TPA: hypothetical protein VN814_08250 [Caulobacteraceae bacterium]|nr:hypothetical protein [Caulobacteraceae bacterium]
MSKLAIPSSGPLQGELIDGGGTRSRRRRGAHRPSNPVARPVSISLWLPLTPLWVLLAPFALLLAPLLSLSREMRGVNPYRAAITIGAVLFALSGTRVHVEAPGANIRIRIF